MRTHIRMHIDKKSGEYNEENYISCILDDDSTEIPPAAATKTPSPEIVDKKLQHGKVVKSPPVENGSSPNDNHSAVDSK